MALVADDGLIGVAMTQAVRHIIIMVWGTGLALGYFACIARALRVRAERVVSYRFPIRGSMLSRPRALPAGFIAPCLPINAPQPPSGEQWLHEIKHDGFRELSPLC